MNRECFMSRLPAVLMTAWIYASGDVFANEVTKESQTSLAISQSAPASIISLKDSMVSAEIAANIERIHVDVGDTVKLGDELARLDCREYDANLEQAQANVKTIGAQKQSAESLVQTRLSDIKASKANEALTKAQAQAERSRISVAQSDYSAAKARLEAEQARCLLANIEFQRARNLRQQRAISQQELDTAQTTLQVARAECQAVESNLISVRANITTAEATARAADAMVKSQEAKTLAAESNLEAAKTNVAVVSATLAAAEARNKTEALMVSRCSLKAPFDGQIVNRMVQLGQRIAAGEKAFQLLSIADAEVVASLSAVELASLQKAQAIYFTAGDKKQEVSVRATVGVITGQASTQEVRLQFKQKNVLPIGQNGRISWSE
ncbi:HlyD family efflux transporter periplasmic adaptor subunit [Leucothrix sargassi]|nr:HlyD family efflux transporter periplasmic adaptor subunit [Leucothrix sargassi]